MCFPTPKDILTLNVMRVGTTRENDAKEGEIFCSDESDRSFIVKIADDRLTIVRPIYRDPRKEAIGIR